jgi:hypothetical protein
MKQDYIRNITMFKVITMVKQWVEKRVFLRCVGILALP